jgi:RNA polymerase sigma-70 factor (ECF subfamily)
MIPVPDDRDSAPMRDLTLTDVERLEAAAEGADVPLAMDEEAFRRFYDRTARPLWAYLSRLTGDRQAADDLLQEAYYRFLRAGVRHDDEQHRRHSLFVTATNLARDRQRRRAARPWSSVPADDRLPSPAADATAQFERRSDLTRAMARLRPRDRSMLWLAYVQGSSHREIAGIVGVKPASVKLLLFRARRRLARLLGAADGASRGAGRA